VRAADRRARDLMARPLTIGLSLALSGALAPMGRQAEAALRLFVNDTNAAGGIRAGAEPRQLALECRDDASDPARCREIYRALVADDRIDLLFGPYASGLTRAAAPIAAGSGRVLINHGGAADDLHAGGNRMIVSVLSPAGEYLTGFVRLLATLKFWRKRLAIVAARTGFAHAVAGGVERACAERPARRHGVRVRVMWYGEFDPAETPARLFPALRRNRVNALVSAGSYEYDVAVMRAIAESALNIPVLACVAAGVERFAADLGANAEGIVGPSQWEESVAIAPALGPAPRQFAAAMRAAGAGCDYVGAQAYAAGLIAAAAIERAGTLDQARIRAALSELRTTTLFGDFAIDPVTGAQVGHKMLLVQWHEGHKVVIEAEPDEEQGALEFPSGWRLILAGVERLRLSLGGGQQESDRDDGGGDNHDDGDKP
jgi:ABC-type branched-subunit amino acid transport system substrate-binding protein